MRAEAAGPPASGLQRALDKIEPVLAPEQLAPVDVTGCAEDAALDRLRHIRRVFAGHRLGVRRGEQHIAVEAVLAGDGGEGPASAILRSSAQTARRMAFESRPASAPARRAATAMCAASISFTGKNAGSTVNATPR